MIDLNFFVPFEMALDLKEAHYPQDKSSYYYSILDGEIYDKQIYTNNNCFIAAPTYRKVFEWLSTKINVNNITEEKLNALIYKALNLI